MAFGFLHPALLFPQLSKPEIPNQISTPTPPTKIKEIKNEPTKTQKRRSDTKSGK